MKKCRRIMPLIAFALGIALTISGCGQKGPRRYGVSGSIKFRGQPVNAGYISFEPNSAKGNRGPATGTMIQNGQYQLDSVRGVVGGPYKIAVDGKDGIAATIDGEFSKTGNFLFPSYVIEREFPKEDTEWNIEVPGK